MNEENKVQNINIESRNKITVTGVIDVECFDENSITLTTTLGTLLIKGNDIKIEKLNLDLNEVVARGDFYMTEYLTDDNRKEHGFFSKMFK